MVGGAVVLHVVSLGLGEAPGDVTWSPLAVVALGYLALGASALGFLVYFDLLDRLGPVEINLVSYVAPVAAAITGFLFLEELVDVWTVLGFCCIFVGFVLIKRRAIRQELPKLRSAVADR